MEQTQSQEGTYSLSAQEAEETINTLRRISINGGQTAVFEYIHAALNRWKIEKVKFAIAGRSATGKSTFINKFRNLKPGDDGFAEAGCGDTTKTPTLYILPKNDQISFCDLPGYSSTTFKKEDYISEMKISDYDFVFIFFNNVLSEDEIWLVRELRMLGKPFALVRSKVDIDKENAIHDGKDPKKIIPEIKEKIEIALDANPELKETTGIFLISSRDPNFGEWSDLMTYIEHNIGEFKAQALLFSLDSITKKSVERKYKMLKKRLLTGAFLAADVAAIPIEGLDVAVRTRLVAMEVQNFMHVFGINRERVNSLEDFDRSLLKCSALLDPHVNMMSFITTALGSCGELGFIQSLLRSHFPFVGPLLSSNTAAERTYTFLHTMLHDIKHDAVLIHEHILTTIEDHRM